MLTQVKYIMLVNLSQYSNLEALIYILHPMSWQYPANLNVYHLLVQ